MNYEEKEFKNLIKQITSSSQEYNRKFFTSLKETSNIKNLSEHFRSFQFKKEKENFIEYKYLDSVYAHCSPITRICLDKREEFLFTSGEDTFLKVWDLQSGMLVHTFSGARASITDLCRSNDNRFLCSVDNTGMLNIYNLTNLTQIFAYDLCSEVDFIEFIKLPKQKKNYFNEFINDSINWLELFDKKEETFLEPTKNDEYILVLVERIGLIHTITFDYESIKSVYTNKTILEISSENFSLNSLCITEGGRFLLMGGNYPFLIVFDLYNLEDNFCVLETGGLPVVFAAAGINLKFAAATISETIFIWEYIPETQFRTGKFKKKNTEKLGAWRKNTINLKGTNSETIHFLQDENYLAMLCNDCTFRVYNNNILLRKVNLMGNELYSYDNYCYVVNNDMVFILDPINSDKILQTISNKFEVTDIICNKEYLMIIDESGRINYFSRNKRINKIPEEQFLKKELNFLEEKEENNKIFNLSGKESEYEIKKKSIIPFYFNKLPNILEEKGYLQLKDDFINIKNFKKKFLYQEEILKEESLSVEPFSDLEEKVELSEEESFITDGQENDDSSEKVVKRRKVGRKPKPKVQKESYSELEETTELESESDFSTESESITESEIITSEETKVDSDFIDDSIEEIDYKPVNNVPRRKAAILAGKEIQQQFNYLYSKEDQLPTLTQQIEKKNEENKRKKKISLQTESEEEIKRTNKNTKLINKKGVSQKKGGNKKRESESTTMTSDYGVSSEISEISESKYKRNKNNPGKSKVGKHPKINLKKLTEEPKNKKTKAMKSRRIKGRDRKKKRKVN